MYPKANLGDGNYTFAGSTNGSPTNVTSYSVGRVPTGRYLVFCTIQEVSYFEAICFIGKGPKPTDADLTWAAQPGKMNTITNGLSMTPHTQYEIEVNGNDDLWIGTSSGSSGLYSFSVSLVQLR